MSILSATYISEASQEFCYLVFMINLLSIISTILQIVQRDVDGAWLGASGWLSRLGPAARPHLSKRTLPGGGWGRGNSMDT